jgi:hypothetical protein
VKKKVLLCLFVIVALFAITGCGKKESSSDNLHKLEFVDMRYSEPKNYSKKEPVDMDGYKTVIYRFNEDDKKSINLYYNKNAGLSNGDEKFEEVTINGVKWKKFHETDFGVTYDTYEYVHNNAIYRIELNEVDKYKDEFDEFMKGVSFEK